MGQSKMEYDKVAWISLHPSKQQEYQNSRLSTTPQEIYNNANKKLKHESTTLSMEAID